MVGTNLRPLHIILRLRYKTEVACTYISNFHYSHLTVSRSLDNFFIFYFLFLLENSNG